MSTHTRAGSIQESDVLDCARRALAFLLRKKIAMFPGIKQENPFPPRSSSEKRLSREEWALIVAVLSAYQHNDKVRPLYEKLVDRQREDDRRAKAKDKLK